MNYDHRVIYLVKIPFEPLKDYALVLCVLAGAQMRMWKKDGGDCPNQLFLDLS